MIVRGKLNQKLSSLILYQGFLCLNLVDMAFRLNLVEKLGSGINKIKDLCDMLELPVDFNISSDWFTVIFYRRLQNGGFSKNVPVKRLEWSELSEREQQILKLIIVNPRISRVQLSNVVGINPSAIQKHITNLKKKQILKRIGSDKGGHWVIIK